MYRGVDTFSCGVCTRAFVLCMTGEMMRCDHMMRQWGGGGVECQPSRTILDTNNVDVCPAVCTSVVVPALGQRTTSWYHM